MTSLAFIVKVFQVLSFECTYVVFILGGKVCGSEWMASYEHKVWHINNLSPLHLQYLQGHPPVSLVQFAIFKGLEGQSSLSFTCAAVKHIDSIVMETDHFLSCSSFPWFLGVINSAPAGSFSRLLMGSELTCTAISSSSHRRAPRDHLKWLTATNHLFTVLETSHLKFY